MDHDRYDLQKSPDGTWMVVDVFTGWPVRVKGELLAGMDVEEADYLVNLLNFNDRKARRYP
jgi:hypothetical protein